eukprot:505408_1
MLSRIVLLPGAFHGSWCYKYITPLLTHMNHEYILVDYPRRLHETYPLHPNSVEEYVNYTANIIKHVSIIQPSLPLFIVGHSLGGLVAANTAEICHQNLHGVILIAATIREGESKDNNKLLATNVKPPKSKGQQFYNDCSVEQMDWAISQLVPEYLYGDFHPKLSDDKFGSVEKLYIQTKRDMIITWDMQRDICDRLGLSISDRNIVQMDTSHSPWLSKPNELAKHIDLFVNRVICMENIDM